MRRRLFTLLSILSLLLFVATVRQWVRSYRFLEELPAAWPDSRLGVTSGSGLFVLAWQATDRPWQLRTEWRVAPILQRGGSQAVADMLSPPDEPGILGFRWYSVLSSNTVRWRVLVVPYWALSSLFLVPPILRVLSLLRHRGKRSAGRCPACGYDLRATPTRCPECGAVPSATAATT
jgi:hypothetical protein